MIKTTIVPVIKNKCGNLADSNNYKPIAIATIVSKLYESTILYKCEDFLKTCDNQFGFKPKHSTEFCIYTLKEFIDYYKQRGTIIFVTFLDASKAFDKIDFWLLFQQDAREAMLVVFSVLTKRICMHKTNFLRTYSNIVLKVILNCMNMQIATQLIMMYNL